MKNISIKEAAVADHFAYDFHTLIQIPEKGIYRFYTFSDDGSMLYIDGKLVVDNDGGHSARRAEGKIALEKGKNSISSCRGTSGKSSPENPTSNSCPM